ncbi:hypothetical protein SAMN04488069_1162 [Hymenobacter psychrophilus]|uniref:Uncharacterized protein n=1 Tax=Hymenobacter psychrophilus TaxID=651662 RepID=A0A1H3N9H5_9BACT|nr:hypothetical protein SAMN04488069_1162 [Hymenobacter psychrophilus]
MEAFLTVCRAIHPLSPGLEAELKRLARPETLPARTMVLEPGTVEPVMDWWPGKRLLPAGA